MASSNPEYESFTRTLNKLLTVSKTELNRRMAAYEREAAKNPNRRGPKPKRKRRSGQ